MIPIPLLIIYSLQRSVEATQLFDLMHGPLWPVYGLPGICSTLAVLVTLRDVWKHQRISRFELLLSVIMLQILAVVPYWIVQLRQLFRRV